LLLSLAIAGVAFSIVPQQYKSDGTAVLVQPKPPGLNSANPLLTFDNSLSTTALIIVQALNSPEVANQLVTPGEDTYTVKAAGSVAVADGQQEPFISVTAQSSDPARSADIVARVMDTAQQELVNRQNALKVPTRNAITLESVVNATPPKPILARPLAASAASFLLGIITTIMAARAWDWLVARLIRRNDTLLLRAEEDIGEPASWSPAVAATARVASSSQTNSRANVSPHH
jgi:capsular polysaccharide biosynthesis protein